MYSLQQGFARYMSEKCFVPAAGKILAAVSGGIDSMTMLHLLHSCGFDCMAAHCNFGLRGKDSDDDELLVKKTAAKYGYSVYSTRFDTVAYAGENGLSIQMAARELRYRQFNELIREHAYDYIAVAHNRDDRLETLLINLARGTGIRGLTSMKPVVGRVIRPLLFASRRDINDYAEKHNVAFREDSSNAGDKYARNYIRHHVIPGLEQYFPDMRQAMERGIEHFSDVETFYNESVERFREQIVREEDGLIYINIKELLGSPSPKTLLYEILRPFGFSDSVLSDALNDTGQQSGRQFIGKTHRLLCDRQRLIVWPLNSEAPGEHKIDENTDTIRDNRAELRIEKFDIDATYKPDKDSGIACLDYDKLRFPLLLRAWKPGDSFRPLGMKQSKKLSDFFIDAKLSLIEKERCMVLVSDGKIVWIVGMRIDDRFRITGETKKLMRIKCFFH